MKNRQWENGKVNLSSFHQQVTPMNNTNKTEDLAIPTLTVIIFAKQLHAHNGKYEDDNAQDERQIT